MLTYPVCLYREIDPAVFDQVLHVLPGHLFFTGNGDYHTLLVDPDIMRQRRKTEIIAAHGILYGYRQVWPGAGPFEQGIDLIRIITRLFTVDQKDLQSAAELPLQGSHMRQPVNAVTAPDCPEIQQDDFAFEGSQFGGGGLVVEQVAERDIRYLITDLKRDYGFGLLCSYPEIQA